MVYKYDYISPCCNNAYSETRSEADPIVNPMCNVCKQQAYELVNQTLVSGE
jgi:hypothetical protein